jgi:sarcosine oxidase/L-pipecolate oxidase
MASVSESYLIIGAGIFGASAALELRKRRPSAKVTLVDAVPFPNPHSATSDLNKIIRSDYGDAFYMKLALEAQEGWRNDPLFQPFYHETGMLYAENKGMAEDFFRKYEQLGHKPHSEILLEHAGMGSSEMPIGMESRSATSIRRVAGEMAREHFAAWLKQR